MLSNQGKLNNRSRESAWMNFLLPPSLIYQADISLKLIKFGIYIANAITIVYLPSHFNINSVFIDV